MPCFQHQNGATVGICQNCGRAVCAEYCQFSRQELACSSACEDALQQNTLVQQRLRQSLGIEPGACTPVSVYSYALFGLILLAAVLYTSITRLQFDFLAFAMSAVFLVMAGLSYLRFRNACLTC